MTKQDVKKAEDALERKALNSLVVFVVGQPDKNHYRVITDKNDLTIKTYTASDIVMDEQCHWSQNWGVDRIARIYDSFWGLGNGLIRKACSHGATIFLLKDFMHGKHPQIKNWMSGSQFKLTVQGLSAKTEALEPRHSRQSCQAIVDKMLKVNREHPADGLSLENLRKFSKLLRMPKELKENHAQ